MKKKLATAVIAATILCGTLNPSVAQASEYVEQPLIYEQEYEGSLYDESKYDDYLLVMPGDGKLIVKGYVEDYYWGENILITDENGVQIIHSQSIKGTKDSPGTVSFVLKKGLYRVRVGSVKSLYNDDDYDNYSIKCYYNFDNFNSVKITSSKKNIVKVSAPKRSSVNGFEIRYRKSGGSWNTINVQGNSNLNYQIKGLKSKAKYQFQARKYVNDSYGDTYFSNWTKVQTIKVK